MFEKFSLSASGRSPTPLVWVLLFLGLAVTQSLRGEEPPDHLITWFYLKGPDGKLTSPPDTVLYLDGKPLGMWLEAVTKICQMEIKPGTRFRFVFPDNTPFERSPYYPPYYGTPLVPYLVSSGAKLEFYHQNKKCDYRCYWWDMKAGGHSSWNETEFFLDGESLGRGLKAAEKLADIKWGYRPVLMVLIFRGTAYPYRGTTPAGWPNYVKDYTMKGEQALFDQKVSAELHEGISRNPVPFPLLKK